MSCEHASGGGIRLVGGKGGGRGGGVSGQELIVGVYVVVIGADIDKSL